MMAEAWTFFNNRGVKPEIAKKQELMQLVESLYFHPTKTNLTNSPAKTARIPAELYRRRKEAHEDLEHFSSIKNKMEIARRVTL